MNASRLASSLPMLTDPSHSTSGAVNPYLPGIGPRTEKATTRLVLSAAAKVVDLLPVHFEVPYPAQPKNRCDVVLGEPVEWAIEVKMLRLMGDNGKPNDMLMHLMPPYPAHRSALTDCEKLLASGFDARKALLVFGYDYDEWPVDPAIDAFEGLAQRRVRLAAAQPARFNNLVHPIHHRGRVFAWELHGS